jgi:hypothetical protein
MTRLGLGSPLARCGAARLGAAGLGPARRGVVGQGFPRYGQAGLVVAWPGVARHGPARPRARFGSPSLGLARRRVAGRGKARRGMASLGSRNTSIPLAWQGSPDAVRTESLRCPCVRQVLLAPDQPLFGQARPQPDNAGSCVSGGTPVPTAETRQGRPRAAESDARRKHFLRLVSEGTPWHQAADEARVKPESVLRMLNDPGFAQVAAALLAA